MRNEHDANLTIASQIDQKALERARWAAVLGGQRAKPKAAQKPVKSFFAKLLGL